jgi:PilZ domain
MNPILASREYTGVLMKPDFTGEWILDRQGVSQVKLEASGADYGRMPGHDLRRTRRIAFTAVAYLQWTEPNGEPMFAQGRCLDLSRNGLRLEVPAKVAVRTTVTLRIDRIQVQGAASVRHVRRMGAKFILGLELNQKLHDKLTANLESSQEVSALASS